MTRYDAFAANLVTWLDDEARAPIPTGELDQALASIASRGPWPERLAGFGSHWVDDPSSATPLRGSWRISVPVLRTSSAVLLLLLTLALIGAAVLIGSRLLERHPEPGRLAYGLDGDIYLADWDGRNPTRVVDGVPSDNPTGPWFGVTGWAPDGRHLLYSEFDAKNQLTVHITDPDGGEVGSFVPSSVSSWRWIDTRAQWSPDSTRLQAWADGSTGIGVYGIDGRRQALIPVPHGQQRFRDHYSRWAPDGRSVVVRLGLSEYWELPIDGSAPRQLAQDDPMASLYSSSTRDGRRVAFATFSLSVANADGTDRRDLEKGHDSRFDPCNSFGACPPSPGQPVKPIWSPDETHVLYAWVRYGSGSTMDSDLRIADVATGTVQYLVADLPDAITPIGWSPAGDKILFETFHEGGHPTLWTVNSDGSGRTLLDATGDSWHLNGYDAP